MIKYLWKKWFPYRGKYFYKNFKRIPGFIGEVRYFLKTGLLYKSTYDMYKYLTIHILKCLEDYKENQESYPLYVGSEKVWKEILEEMIQCLKTMKKYQDVYYYEEYETFYLNAKNRFFELFREYFESLWY